MVQSKLIKLYYYIARTYNNTTISSPSQKMVRLCVCLTSMHVHFCDVAIFQSIAVLTLYTKFSTDIDYPINDIVVKL